MLLCISIVEEWHSRQAIETERSAGNNMSHMKAVIKSFGSFDKYEKSFTPVKWKLMMNKRFEKVKLKNPIINSKIQSQVKSIIRWKVSVCRICKWKAFLYSSKFPFLMKNEKSCNWNSEFFFEVYFKFSVKFIVY